MFKKIIILGALVPAAILFARAGGGGHFGGGAHEGGRGFGDHGYHGEGYRAGERARAYDRGLEEGEAIDNAAEPLYVEPSYVDPSYITPAPGQQSEININIPQESDTQK